MFKIYIVIGIIFGLLAALMAFVITWREYERHQFTQKRIFKEAFQSAIFAFAIFLFLSLVVSFFLTRFILK